MRLLGIDYGTKKVGLALSDESGSMAFPHSIIPNNADLLSNVVQLIKEEKAEQVVVGQSMQHDGTSNTVQEEINQFVTALEKETGVSISSEPEFYTTAQANRDQDLDKADASAAALILNGYIERNTKRSVTDW